MRPSEGRGTQCLLASAVQSSLSPVSSDLGGVRDTPTFRTLFSRYLGKQWTPNLHAHVRACAHASSLTCASECVHICVCCPCVPSPKRRKISFWFPLPQLPVPVLPLWPQNDAIYRTQLQGGLLPGPTIPGQTGMEEAITGPVHLDSNSN